jgi:hypothetical protein
MYERKACTRASLGVVQIGQGRGRQPPRIKEALKDGTERAGSMLGGRGDNLWRIPTCCSRKGGDRDNQEEATT